MSPPFSELLRTFAKIGFLSFGGPAGQIALMHRVLVDEKKWLEERQFLHALNFCMLLPGPEAMQLATYSGWLLHGVRGGLAAGLLFILPGFAVILALSSAYVILGDQRWMQGLLFGLQAAVLALVLEALLRVSRRALKDGFAWAIAASAFIAIAILKLPFPFVIATAAVAGAAWHFLTAGAGSVFESATKPGQVPSVRGPLLTVAIWMAIWLVPLAVLSLLDPGNGFFAEAALFFSKAAAVTFGGAYAVLVYAGQQAVDVYGWLKPGEMLTGLGFAETTPGPLILVLVFIAFVGGARLTGLEPWIGGVAGGFTALWFTFAPCFLWIFAGAPWIERLSHVRWLSAALSAVTAAVVGVIANLALWFGLHVLFGSFTEQTFGPFHFPAADWQGLDIRAAFIAASSALALMRFQANLLAVLSLAMAAGMVLA